MKSLLFALIIFILWTVHPVQARTVEIDIHGMTCAFCVDSLEKRFGKMESVSRVEVSLKQKKVRLKTDDNLPSIETIKQTILDAGFTPIKITVQQDGTD